MMQENQDFSMDLRVFTLPTQVLLQLNCLLHELSIEADGKGPEDYGPIVKVLSWHVYDHKTDEEEVQLLFSEWLRSRDIHPAHHDFLDQNIRHSPSLSLFPFLKLLSCQLPFALLPRLLNLLLDTINRLYNAFFSETLREEGLFSQDKIASTLAYLEELYLLLDPQGVGYIRLSGIVVLFQFLRAHKVVDVKLQQFLQDINGYKAKVTLRQFKRYFLRQRIAQKHDFLSLKGQLATFLEEFRQRMGRGGEDFLFGGNFTKLINRQPQIQKHGRVVTQQNLAKIRQTDIYVNSLYLYGLLHFEDDFVEYQLGLHPHIDYYDCFNDFYSWEFIDDMQSRDYGDFFFILQQNYQVLIDEALAFDRSALPSQPALYSQLPQVPQTFDDRNQNKFFDLLNQQFNSDKAIDESLQITLEDKKETLQQLHADLLLPPSDPKQNLSRLFEESHEAQKPLPPEQKNKVIDLKQFKKSSSSVNESLQSKKDSFEQVMNSLRQKQGRQ